MQPDSRLFAEFVSFFPPVEMPVTLGEESHLLFSTENRPLPENLLEIFLHPHEKESLDEYTEFVPCFSFVPNPEVVALVYWRAGLLHYAYMMVTYSPRGRFIGRSIVSQMGMGEEGMRHSAATFGTDFSVLVAEGDSNEHDVLYKTRHYSLEILADGTIVSLEEESI